MFRSLFGRNKRRREAESPLPDETIRSARVGDVVVISGFSPTYEDAYFIVEGRNRYESPFGEWYELLAVDGDRKVAIEWYDADELFITVNEQDGPMGLSAMGLDYDALVALDDEHSIENYIVYEDEKYFYRNSYEAHFFKDNAGEGEGFYVWEFMNEAKNKTASVVKWEGMPFQAYASVVVPPHDVTVYRK